MGQIKKFLGHRVFVDGPTMRAVDRRSPVAELAGRRQMANSCRLGREEKAHLPPPGQTAVF